jgi:hypothetical protein
MQLSLLEWEMLLDSLHGSLRLADGANLFRFTRDSRHELAEAIAKRSGAETITVDFGRLRDVPLGELKIKDGD